MVGDSEIKNIFPQYPVVDRVQQINPGSGGARRKKSAEDSGKDKKDRKESDNADRLEITDKKLLADETDSTSQRISDSDDGAGPDEPGGRIDLIV